MAGEDDLLQRIVGLINGIENAVIEPGSLQLNVSLNTYLLERVVETRKFLQTESVRKSRQGIVEPLKVLQRIVTDAGSIVRECCELPWIQAAIRQAENKESFFEVLKDLHWCTGVVRSATLKALHERGDSISDPEVSDRFLKPAHAVEKRIRKEVDDAAMKDKIALKSRLDLFISGSEAGHTQAEHLAIAKHLKSWFQGEEIGHGGYGSVFKCIWQNLKSWFKVHHIGHKSAGNFPTLIGLQQREEIGHGGFSSVFKCTWQGLEFAEKRFFSVAYREIFIKEANLMRDVRHPNVVRLVAKDDAECKLVLELMDGSLTDLINERTSFRLADTVDILLQISKAMLFLHEKRVAHRDIKSGNILYNIADGYIHVKVADFGLAKLKLKSAMPMTVNMGTSMWTAPELIKPRVQNPTLNLERNPVKQTVSVKHALRSADVYSFGITCFEVAAGTTNPYSGHCEGGELQPLNFVHKVVVEGLRPKIPVDTIPNELVYLMKICWSQDPSSRPTFAYIYNFLRDFKASLLTDPGSPFRYEEWEGEVDSRWSRWWRNFLGTLAGASGLIWGWLFVAVVWAIRMAILLFTKRFKSLEEITDRDVRSRQIPYQTLEAATVGRASQNIRHVKLSKDVEASVTKTSALSEDVFLKGAFFLTQLEAHPNLPTLIGYSVHDNNFYLVHKADSVNVVGSLHEVMSLSADGDWRVRHSLTWAQRYNIALGVGQALACLHQLRVPIIHGNLSSRTIMLEKDTYNPKLFNFYTMSCMFPGPGIHSNFLTTDTRGWDAPEKEKVRGDRTAFAQDVYSFGVLLLVLVTDRNAFTASNTRMHVHIADEAWEYFHTGKIRDLEGPEVKGDPDVVVRVLRLALHCVQTDAHNRPKIAEAVDMLTGKNEMKDSALTMFKWHSLTPKTAKAQSQPSSSVHIKPHCSDVSEKVGRAHHKHN